MGFKWTVFSQPLRKTLGAAIFSNPHVNNPMLWAFYIKHGNFPMEKKFVGQPLPRCCHGGSSTSLQGWMSEALLVWSRCQPGRRFRIPLEEAQKKTKAARHWWQWIADWWLWCGLGSHEGVRCTGLLLMAYPTSFLIKPRTTSPWMEPPTMGWTHPHQ